MLSYTTSTSSDSVAVIGAGIVGCATALALTMKGYRVTVFDPDSPGAGTSSGNAGAIVTGSVLPTATPGVLRALPKYLLDPYSPAKLRFRHLPQALPWLLRFVRAGMPEEVARISPAIASLSRHALTAYQPLLKASNSECLVTQDGWLKVYASQAEFEGTALDRELMANAGVAFEVLDKSSVLDLEPNLNSDYCHSGMFQRQSGFVKHPQKLAEHFMSAACASGAEHITQSVKKLQPTEGGGIEITTSQATHRFSKVVVAAGAWSGELAKQLGDKVLLDAERGYHMMFTEADSSLLGRPVSFPGLGMVLSPMGGSVRMLNGTELAGLKAKPDYRRIHHLTPKAQHVLPALQGMEPSKEWMGFRPSTPDSLPVIGRSPRCADVFYAFGHGHLGLTLAARTAEMIAAEMLSGSTAEGDDVYLIDRFA